MKRVFSLLVCAWAVAAEAEVRLRPSGGDDTPQVAAALAAEGDGAKLVFEKGEYHFHASAARRLFLEPSNNASCERRVVFPLTGRKNAVIDGGGSRFVFHDGTTPFAVLKSEGVVLRDFSVVEAVAPYVALQVTAMDEAGFSVACDPKTAPFETKGHHLCFHALSRGKQDYFMAPDDPESRDWVPTGFLSFTVERRAGNTAYCRYAPDPHPKNVKCRFKIGEPIAFNLAGNRERMFCFAEDSRNLTVEGVTLNSFGGMGIVAQRTEDVTVLGVKVVPEEGFPVTLTADAMHFINCGGTIRIEGCEVSFMLDDACNVHGNYLEVVETQGRSAKLHVGHFEQAGFIPYRVGDRVEFVERRRRTVLASAVVRKVVRHSSREATIETDADLARIPVGALVEDVSLCPNVVYRGNHLHDFPHVRLSGRGKILVENNVIERCQKGLICYDLAEYWYESGRLSDLTVRNNVFDRCCSRRGKGAFVEIGLTGWKASDPEAPRVHGKVVLENNRFLGDPGDHVTVFGVQNLIRR